MSPSFLKSSPSLSRALFFPFLKRQKQKTDRDFGIAKSEQRSRSVGRSVDVAAVLRKERQKRTNALTKKKKKREENAKSGLYKMDSMNTSVRRS